MRGLDPATLQRCVDDPAAVRAISERLDSMVSLGLDPAVEATCKRSVQSPYDLAGAKGIDAALGRAVGEGAPTTADSTADEDLQSCHVAPPPAHLGINWRQYLAPLPPGAVPDDTLASLRLDARQYDAYVTYLILAVGVHAHSKTCRKGGRGEECCRLAYAAGCWDTLPAPVELLRSKDGTVFALRAMTPRAVANPPEEHNPFFPLVRPDSRVVTWELFRPSANVTREQGRAELDSYLQRCKDKLERNLQQEDWDALGQGCYEDQQNFALVRAAMHAAGPDPTAREAAATAAWETHFGQDSDHEFSPWFAEELAITRAAEDAAGCDPEARAAAAAASVAARVPHPPVRTVAPSMDLPCECGHFDQDLEGPNQWVVPHSRVVTSCVRCNTSMNLLLNQDAARCASFYLAK